MRGVDDVFVLQRRVASVELRNDVLRVDRPQRVLDGHRRGDTERHRLEVARRRLLLQGIEILTGERHQLLRAVERDPSFDVHAAHVLVRRDEIELLRRLRLDDLEGIAGGLGLVDDEHGGGAHLRANLVLVGPAAVVGHRLAAERLRIVGHRGIVDEHHQRLALDVDALVVVPFVFGRDDPIADKHEIGLVDARGIRDVLGPRHHIVFPFQRQLAAALLEHERRGGRRDADERHLLHVRAVAVSRLQAKLLELIDEIADRQLLASRAGPAPFELVGRENFGVREDRLRIHRRQL